MKHHRRHIIIGIAAAVIIAIIALLGGASWYMLDYSLMPSSRHCHNLPLRLQEITRQNPQIKPWVDSLKKAQALRDTFLTMPSGERHHATLIPPHWSSDRLAVCIHGYCDNGMGMMHIASMYHRMGFAVVLPDLHAHGRSEGGAIEMGWKERKDILQWIHMACSMGYKQLVVHGISMGAATTMSLSGDSVPQEVKCYVEDCGYTSVWDEFSGQLREQFSMPPFPLLYTASALCKLRFGWSFTEASPLNQVRKCRRPMLFIHGDADTYVPFSMLAMLYEAKSGPKERWISPGSIHARSFQDHPSEYTEAVSKFVSKYIDNRKR